MQQQSLFRRGGKRRGAGRKPTGARARVSHDARPTIKACHALHVTLRVMQDLPPLRRRDAYRALRAASAVAARRPDFRIVHLSIQTNHLHLIVEADDTTALTRGMQSFQISAARRLNALFRERRRGRVFADRYHLVVIRSPTQMRRVLSYVLSNWRKHGADRGVDRAWVVDPYSTGFAFTGWKELRGNSGGGVALWPEVPAGAKWLVVKPARSWVLTVGWQRCGEISAYDVPGKRPD